MEENNGKPVKIITYFTLMSPWSYFGHQRLVDMATKLDVSIDFRPCKLGEVVVNGGGQPLPKRHPKRQSYRFLELQRASEEFGVPLVLRPKHFPTEIALADKCAIVLQEMAGPVAQFCQHAYQGVWVNELDLAKPKTLANLLETVGAEAEVVIAKASSEAAERQYQANTEAAMAGGVFGAPSYLWQGELFWGQDRLGQLERAIGSGRTPFTVPN
ncbi:2-hydroxychromene-2-carboxylate isomerase [Polycladidibacter hongkongensis]|uniref:2-hydroxychromene-2-carboxylate isomerase n=1 Tax=Polycladidibacter hongkongensis TaxID=1647556 RepID=UPI000836E684|nr:2-hydroxychromene-2-carboxylate isomerase [Pseudovibrio hongkongensis]